MENVRDLEVKLEVRIHLSIPPAFQMILHDLHQIPRHMHLHRDRKQHQGIEIVPVLPYPKSRLGLRFHNNAYDILSFIIMHICDLALKEYFL